MRNAYAICPKPPAIRQEEAERHGGMGTVPPEQLRVEGFVSRFDGTSNTLS